jgi:predicted N-acetyltransferase YhbS
VPAGVGGQQEYLEKNWVTVLRDAAGTLLGFYALMQREGQRGVELDHLCVEPTYLNRRLGKKLFQDACEQARKRGYTLMVIHSEPYAAAFYRRMGAEQIGFRASAVLDDYQLPLFALQL